MTEIKIIIYQNEIEMLKDFMKKGCGIDDIHLQWTDDLYTLLTSLGKIVTAPGFEIENLQGYSPKQKPAIKETIGPNGILIKEEIT